MSHSPNLMCEKDLRLPDNERNKIKKKKNSCMSVQLRLSAKIEFQKSLTSRQKVFFCKMKKKKDEFYLLND